MIKIALIGKKYTGRTFLSIYLRKQHDFKIMRLSAGVEKLLRFFYMYPKFKRPKFTDKYDFYDALYKIDPTIHVNHFLWRVSKVPDYKNIVVDDVRYLSELDFLKENGFIVIRIEMPDKTKQHHIGAMVRKADKGTIVLSEFFGKGTARYNADYSIYGDTKEGIYESISKILDTLRANELK